MDTMDIVIGVSAFFVVGAGLGYYAARLFFGV